MYFSDFYKLSTKLVINKLTEPSVFTFSKKKIKKYFNLYFSLVIIEVHNKIYWRSLNLTFNKTKNKKEAHSLMLLNLEGDKRTR